MAEADSQTPNPPAATSEAAPDPLLGRILNGRFSILEPIGAGGMGRVYKAIQSPLDRLVAVKVLHPQFSNQDTGFVRRFVLEASLTSKLRHPNTVTVIDYGQTEDHVFYIAMEYLEGRTVADVLAKDGALPWDRALHIGQQVCRSLREAHKLGVIHRDLKPANVMLLDEADNDQVKVLDFGLVKSFMPDARAAESDSKITQAGMLLGSPQYMAPEQARSVSDPRSDVYSFGVLLYEMLLGKPPFMARDYLEVIVKHMREAPPPFRSMRPDLAIPPTVEALVMRCLQKDPAARFQSMDEVLEGMRATGGVQIHHSGAQSRPGSGSWPALATPPPQPLRQVTPGPGELRGQGPMTPTSRMGQPLPPPGSQHPSGPYPQRPPSGSYPQPQQGPYPQRAPSGSYPQPQQGSYPQPPSGPYPQPPSGSYPQPPSGPYPQPPSGSYPQPPSGSYPQPQPAYPQRPLSGSHPAMSPSGAYAPPQSGPAPAPPSGVYPEPPWSAVPTQIMDVPAEPPAGSISESAFFARPPAPRSKGLWVALGLLAMVAMGALGYALAPRGKPAPAPSESAAQAEVKPGPAPAAPVAATPAPVPAPQPATAGRPVKFRVNSEPAGARVFLGARDLGVTPLIFEMPPQPDGTATAELVFILDGYHPLAATAGGSGDVVLSQRLQKKSGRGSSDPARVAAAGASGSARQVVSARFDERIDAPTLIAPDPKAPADKKPDSAPAAATVAAASASPAPTPQVGAEVMHFGEGMSRPELLQGAPITLPREAIAAKVEGLMIAKCIINPGGRLERCHVLKSLPHMEKAVLDSLYARVYRPVTFQGRPVAVEYVFDVQVAQPR